MQSSQNSPRSGAKTVTASMLTVVESGMLPASVELEQAILGAIMLERTALTRVTDTLTADMFYKPAHADIYTAMLQLSNASEPIDKLTVMERLKKNKALQPAGGPFYIAELTSRVASAANIEHHADIVAQKYIQRELIRICRNVGDEAGDESIDIFDLLDNAEKQLYELSTDKLRRDSVDISQLTHTALTELQGLMSRGDGITGVPSYYPLLDNITCGWQPSDLVVLAARPAMGKTAFMLSLAKNAAVEGATPVVVFSLEMSATQLVKRLMASEAEIEMQKMRTGQLTDAEWNQIMQRMTRLSEAPIYIDDTPALRLFDLRTKCRRLKSQKGIGLVVIDYLQLMKGEVQKGGNREQEISSISRGLKVLAKELDVPIIALSQLSRAVEQRSGIDKRPMLSDLRESGAIEQDADMVMFLYRPEYYELLEDEDGNSTRGMCEVIVAKQRNGPTDRIKLRFNAAYSRFENWENNAPPAFYHQGKESGYEIYKDDVKGAPF